MDFFTLRALADEWNAALAGARIDAAWTQDERELSLALVPTGGEAVTLRVRCDPALMLAFAVPGAARRKRHTADVFDGIAGRRLRLVRAADRDRVLHLHLEGGEQLALVLFGPRPNVLWVRADGTVRDAFLRAADLVEAPAPAPRPAPDPATADEVIARWRAAPTLSRAVRAAAPLLPPLLAADVVRAAGLDPDAPAPGTCPSALAEAVAALRARLDAPAPVVVERNALAEAVLPVPLQTLPAGWTQTSFATTDDAVRTFARRALAQARFASRWRPLEAAVASAAARRRRAADAMRAEIAQPSRAGTYEAWAHLLMAAAAGRPAGDDAVTLPDWLGDGPDVTIPLDPARTAVENAERYYERARAARRARETAEARLAHVEADAAQAEALLARLREARTLDDLDALLGDEADALAAIRRTAGHAGESAEPFHRVPLPDGWTALVGKNARSNAHLTAHVARPHDLWLHARGVAGSHVVVPRGSRTTAVPEHVVRAAAALAAQHSKARTQSVVPVTVTERKYVRPVKGGALGLVRIERERVVDVAPGRA